MQYLYEFIAALDGGRPLQPRHELITNQVTRYQERMVLGVSADGLTYAAFLPQGGTISLDLTALAGSTVGVTWYNPLTGQYRDQGTTPGGGPCTPLSRLLGPANRRWYSWRSDHATLADHPRWQACTHAVSRDGNQYT
jgi:Putative collagen-binding domain of a collagenase